MHDTFLPPRNPKQANLPAFNDHTAEWLAGWCRTLARMIDAGEVADVRESLLKQAERLDHPVGVARAHR